MNGRLNTFIAVLSLGLVLGMVLGARVGGPGDLYDKDQPKTMAASADVALNGRWVWPRDMLTEPSTKPPMYNWLDAAVLRLSPRWGEWAFKLPSIVAAVAIAGIILTTTLRLLPAHDHAGLVALLAAAIWLASKPAMKQMYLSRPDMVLAAFLTGAWICAAGLIAPRDRPGAPRIRLLAVVFWLCVSGAILSKGPAALIPLAYVPLLALLLHRSVRPAGGVRWLTGIAILLATAGAWTVLAYRQWPHAFLDILRAEGVSRFTTGGPEAIGKPAHLPAWWFVKEFAPWSLLAGIGVVLIGLDPRRWVNHPLAPAIVWVALAIVAFSVAPGKRADYLLPAYPAAAMLAAFGLIEATRRVRLPLAIAAIVPVLMAGYLAHWEIRRSPEARSGATRTLLAFVRDVDAVVPPEAPLISVVKGYQPYLTLLRRHEGNRADADNLRPGTWVIAPRNDAWPAHAMSSGALPDVVQVDVKKIVPGYVGLYRIGDPRVTPQVLLPLLDEQEAWNFPPDRYRATRRHPATRP